MISAKYIFSVEELIKASRHAATEQARHIFRLLLLLVGICMLFVGLFLLGESKTLLRVYLGLAGAYIVFLRRPIATLVLRKQFAKRPDRNIEVRFEASDDGMKCSTEHSNSSFRWNLVSKVRRYKDGFLIFPVPKIFHWIPNHAFASPDEVEAMSEIFKRNVKDYKEAA